MRLGAISGILCAMSNTVLPLIPLRPALPPAPPCGAPAVPELPPRDALASAVRELKSRLDAIVVAKADLVDGKVPASQLPSYVDDVVEVAELPQSGESGKLYVVTGTNAVYRWSGSSFVEVSPSRDWSGELAAKRGLTDFSVGDGWLLVKPDGTPVWMVGRGDSDIWVGDDELEPRLTRDSGPFGEAWIFEIGPLASGERTHLDIPYSEFPIDSAVIVVNVEVSTYFDGVYRLVRGSRLALDTEVPVVDDTVARASGNPVKSSGIWSAIWGALTALPTGVASLYDWVVAQLAGKRGLGDLSYERQGPSEGGWILHIGGNDVRLLPAGELTWTDTGSEADGTYNLKWLGQWHLAYVAGSGLATCVDQESQEDATELTLVSTSDYETVVATATAAPVDDRIALVSEVAAKASVADLHYRIAEAELAAKLPTGVTLAKDGVAVDHEFYVYSDHISILPDDIEKEVFSWDLDGTNGRDGADYGYDNLVLMQNGSVVQPSAVELTVFRALADRTVNRVTLPSGTTEATIVFPEKAPGYSRDFMVRLVVEGSDVPQISFAEPDGSDVAFDEDDDAWASLDQGVNILIFTDTSEPETQVEP